MQRILTALWERWKLFGHKLGNFQARLLLFVFYYTIFAPFALGLKLLSDPLRLRPQSTDRWLERPDSEADNVTLAKRQF